MTNKTNEQKVKDFAQALNRIDQAFEDGNKQIMTDTTDELMFRHFVETLGRVEALLQEGFGRLATTQEQEKLLAASVTRVRHALKQGRLAELQETMDREENHAGTRPPDN